MAVYDYNGEKSFEGCVIRLWERNGYEDSDFYAECIDLERGKIVDVEYDTTRFGGCGRAYVDLQEEVYKKYLRLSFDREFEEYVKMVRKEEESVAKGKFMKVVKGRSVPVGVVGECIWVGEKNYNPYGRGLPTKRVGIRDAEGKVWWTNASNVVVILPCRVPMHILHKAFKKKRSDNFMKFKRVFSW